MSTEGADGPTGAIHADADSLAAAAAAAGDRHVALIAEGTVDDWQRRLDRASTAGPSHRHFVSVDDTLRGGAAATATPTGRPLGGGVVLSSVAAPVTEPSTFLAEALADAPDGEGGSVVVDDPAALVGADNDPVAAAAALAEAAAEHGLELHVGLGTDDEALVGFARLLSSADDETETALAERLLSYLRGTDPTNFGYLRRHWRDARRGLTAVGMTYPQSKQVHAALPDTEATPRTLGAALQALVKLGALGVWGDTVAANRYDLTGHDPQRVDAIGEALDALED